MYKGDHFPNPNHHLFGLKEKSKRCNNKFLWLRNVALSRSLIGFVVLLANITTYSSSKLVSLLRC